MTNGGLFLISHDYVVYDDITFSTHSHQIKNKTKRELRQDTIIYTTGYQHFAPPFTESCFLHDIKLF